eukprot:6095507-Amphidinium_carterae.1
MCERDNSATPPQWVFFLDCAPVHLSAETTAMLRAREPLHTVFFQRNSTGNQPLDVAYFRSFKATLRRGVAEAWAQDVLSTASPEGRVTSKPLLKLNL